MNNATPMKKCNNEFRKFNEIMTGKLTRFQLNKSKPKDIPYPFGDRMTKGVLSDCVYIYHNTDTSFGFSFNYVNCKEEFVTVTHANNMKVIVNSVTLRLKDFRNFLKKIIKEVNPKDFKNSNNLILEIYNRSNNEKDKDVTSELHDSCRDLFRLKLKEQTDELSKKGSRKKGKCKNEMESIMRNELVNQFPLFISRDIID